MTTGVILDSGGVLIRPVGGSWFPPPAFRRVLAQRGIATDESMLEPALRSAYAYLDEVHPIPLVDENGERLQFVEYFRRVLEGIAAPGDHDALASEIDALHRSDLPVELFPWTLPVLRDLQQRAVPVVILSDAWPSLRRHYLELGLAPFVKAMVISAEEGVSKPHPRMYERALDLLGTDEAFFVDDWAYNVRGANSAGLRGIHLLHPDGESDETVEVIRDLSELPAMVAR